MHVQFGSLSVVFGLHGTIIWQSLYSKPLSLCIPYSVEGFAMIKLVTHKRTIQT